MSVAPTACILGWPLSHTRSPLIHRFWLRSLGIAGDYLARPVAPDDIAAVLQGFAAGTFVGGNVTIPYKEQALAAVADADPAARAIGAVNTLWAEGGRLLGANTDAVGFLASLDADAPGWGGGGPAVVLGAGGAARAIVWALLQRRFAPVTIVNRTPERAEGLALRFGSGAVAASWSDLPALLETASLLVNTTSLGMVGQPALDVDLAPLPATAIVTDLVYAPLETPLLAAAKARALRTVDGLGMLLHQAAPGFERWFGVRPAVTPELRALVVADLRGR